jgi:membrane-bound metal-dependent hydrolase YbcI (DUF457 family)
MLAIFALAGAVADVDFLLPLQHRGPSHSLGAAVLVFAASLVATRKVRPALAIAAAYASHTLLDWLGADSSSPHGLMALWPVSATYYVSGLDLFSAVSRRYWLPGFWRSIGLAVAREILILGPIAAISTRRILGRSSGRGGRQPPSA